MERVVFEGQENLRSTGPKVEAENNTHFEKLQEYLYKKFGYSEINKRRIPVKLFQSPIFTKRTQKDELFGHKIETENEIVEMPMSGAQNPIRELRNAGIATEFPTKTNSPTNPYLGILEDIRRRKEKKLPKKPPGKSNLEGRRHNANQRFADPEKEKNEMEITPEEAKKCIQLLNRNIKMHRARASAKSFSSEILEDSAIGNPEYVDIDNYIAKFVEGAINGCEIEKAKPHDFSK